METAAWLIRERVDSHHHITVFHNRVAPSPSLEIQEHAWPVQGPAGPSTPYLSWAFRFSAPLLSSFPACNLWVSWHPKPLYALYKTQQQNGFHIGQLALVHIPDTVPSSRHCSFHTHWCGSEVMA